MTAWWNQQWDFGDSEDCTAFAWVESELYPGLAVWYESRAAAWRVKREAEDPGWSGVGAGARSAFGH